MQQEEAMAVTLEDIEGMDKEFLLASDIAPILSVDPQDIRTQARIDPNKLGFPVIVTGSRTRIPRRGFVYFCRYGRPAGQTPTQSK